MMKAILILLLFSPAHADISGQVLAGMAWWYRYYAVEQSPQDRGRFESAEDEARVRGWGLWADPDPINPYEWRKIPRYQHGNEER